MATSTRFLAGLTLFLMLGASISLASTPTFICSEPGGKRLIQVDPDGKSIYRVEAPNKMVLFIDGNNILPDPHGEPIFVVDEHDVRHTSTGIKLAVFDGNDIRHGTGGKVLMNYQHPNLCPDRLANRVYSIEGPGPLTKQQLVAFLYLLKPGIFDLTNEEIAEQKKAMKEAELEAERLAAADQVAGKWTMLNSHGPIEKLGKGTIAIGPKKGAAYPVTYDLTSGGGPTFTGVGVYKEGNGDKQFWVAYGTPKTIGMCVYEIKGGSLEGTWYPWYIDGAEKNTGTETLAGPENGEGEFKITAAKAPFTGATYTGTVAITPLKIVGSADDAKPYSVVWTIGGAKISGIGIRTRNFLYVSSGAGADVMIGKFIIHNGTMTSDWFKLGSTEMGGNAAMN